MTQQQKESNQYWMAKAEQAQKAAQTTKSNRKRKELENHAAACLRMASN